MNLVGYGRVSSESQRENTSLSSQKDALIQYCERFGHNLVAYYEDVESGATIEKRENFQWALKTVAALADGLLVYRLDRLTRSVLDGERLKQTLAKQGKQLLSVSDAIDLATDNGEFVFTISTAIAQMERKRIKARCDEGRDKKAAEGGYYAGSPPYGYVNFRKHLMEYPFEQQVIRKVREKYWDEGWSLRSIAAWMNEEKFPTKTKKGLWTHRGVKRLISGDPPIVDRLRASGQLLSTASWEAFYDGESGKSRRAVDPARNEEAS